MHVFDVSTPVWIPNQKAHHLTPMHLHAVIACRSTPQVLRAATKSALVVWLLDSAGFSPQRDGHTYIVHPPQSDNRLAADAPSVEL